MVSSSVPSPPVTIDEFNCEAAPASIMDLLASSRAGMPPPFPGHEHGMPPHMQHHPPPHHPPVHHGPPPQHGGPPPPHNMGELGSMFTLMA